MAGSAPSVPPRHLPYRVTPGDGPAVLDYIEHGAGTDFDPDGARTFVDLMRRIQERIEHLAGGSPLGCARRNPGDVSLTEGA